MSQQYSFLIKIDLTDDQDGGREAAKKQVEQALTEEVRAGYFRTVFINDIQEVAPKTFKKLAK